MFKGLLRGILEQNGLDHVNAKAQYLRELQTQARRLWQSYRTQNVLADYSQAKTQEAYLLRYFPFYTRLVETELDDLRERGFSVPDVELLEACLFGCGPGPEVIGLMRFLKNSNAKTTMLIARMVDTAGEEWSYAREICREFVAEPLWAPGLFEYETITTSFSNVQVLSEIALEGCHIAVVQNCLNEVPDNSQEKTVQTILGAFNRLQTGAIALVIDRANYAPTTKMMRMMVENIANFPRLEVIGDGDFESIKRINCSDLLSKVPTVVTDNLLYISRGTIPPEWSGLTLMSGIDYNSIAFQVGATPTEPTNF
jgi:hypothetical protein